MNTINPVIQVVAHLDSERQRVGFMPITGGSLDELSEPITHSVITGASIPSAAPSALAVFEGLREAGYEGADFVLVGWSAREILCAIKPALPELHDLFNGKTIDFYDVTRALSTTQGGAPYSVTPPASWGSVADAVRDVYRAYRDVILFLASSTPAPEPNEAPTMAGKLIGVGGLKGHGKDAFAHSLKVEWVTIGMSDPLYDALLALDPLVYHEGTPALLSDFLCDVCAGDWVVAKRNPDVRRLLQRLGTDVVREMIDEDAWVSIMRARVSTLLALGHNVVVTGVRFQNELEAIKELGGTTVWITRPGFSDDVPDTHPSENTLKPQDFQFIVENSGTLDDLAKKAYEIISLDDD